MQQVKLEKEVIETLTMKNDGGEPVFVISTSSLKPDLRVSVCGGEDEVFCCDIDKQSASTVCNFITSWLKAQGEVEDPNK
jgi:hypothetical protein